MGAYGKSPYGVAAYGVDTTAVKRILTLSWDVKSSIPATTPKLPVVSDILQRPQTPELTGLEKRGER